MENLRALPFFKLLAPLIVGIITSSSLHLNWALCFLFLILSFTLAIFFHKWTLMNLGGKSLSSIAIYIHVFFWGIFLSKYHEVDTSLHNKEEKFHVLRISSPWKKTTKGYQVELTFLEKAFYKKGKVLLYSTQNWTPKSKPGDLILFKSSIRNISPSLNPYQFDFKTYSLRKGIAFTSFIKGNYYCYNTYSRPLLNLSIRIQIILKKIIDSSTLSIRSKALVKALLLGDKSELDESLKSSFSEAGVIHVLAVSGLHVGIIVLLFSKVLIVLRVIKNRRIRQLTKTLLLLFAIWLFASISGFSPSIIRAAIMFSFLTIGQLLLRHSSIYNSLCLAAFFMLFIDPNYIYALGFQLSFLAVIGIVFFHPRIYKGLYFKSKILSYFWGLSALSISAQIMTFPLTIYYFHQFPLYFILSNLIVIPAIFLLLLLSILFLVFSFINPISTFLSILINNIVSFLGVFIEQLNQLPYHSLKTIIFDRVNLILLFIILCMIMFYIITKKVNFLLSALLVSCLFYSNRILNKTEVLRTKELVIYSFKNKVAINLFFNKEHFLFTDSDESIKIENLIAGSYLRKGLANSIGNFISLESNELIINTLFMQSENHIIVKDALLCLNHSSHKKVNLKRFKYRICSLKNFKIGYNNDLSSYSHIVFNGLNKKLYQYNKRGFRKEASIDKYHSLAISGAFTLRF